MRPTARSSFAALTLLVVALLVSGCIVEPDWWWNDSYPPREAAFQVYVCDYWSTMPIQWAVVELYEADWWSWDYRGSWPVNPGGYATIHAGYLYSDGYGGPAEREYRLVVRASGYCSEAVDITLDYYHPWESAYFYLIPWDAGTSTPGVGGEPAAEPPIERRPPERVVIGGPKEVSPGAGE